MPEHAARIESAPPGSGPTLLELQRTGMRELLRLSREAVGPEEARLEARLRERCADPDARAQTFIAEVESRLADELAGVERAHAEQVQKIEAEHAAAVATCNQKGRAALERINANARELEATGRAQLQDRLLLADTMAEANRQRLRGEFRTTEEQVGEGRRNVDALRARAADQLRRYAVELPPDPAPAPGGKRTGDVLAEYERQAAALVAGVRAIEGLWAPRLFVGVRPYVIMVLICAAVVAGSAALIWHDPANFSAFVLAGGITLVVAVGVTWLVGRAVGQAARARLVDEYTLVAQAAVAASAALERALARGQERYERELAKIAELERKNPEKLGVQKHLESVLADARRRDVAAREQAQAQHAQQLAELERQHTETLRAAEEHQGQQVATLRARAEREIAGARAACAQAVAGARAEYEAARAELEAGWRAGLEHVRRLAQAADDGRMADAFAARIPLGRWELDLTQLAPSAQRLATFLADLPARVTTPALLLVPERAALFLQTERAGRTAALALLRLAMVRLVQALPPGRVRFTILDPVGLGESFAGFMHLADYEEALVGTRIWTESEHIEARLTELTAHMENVIQKYLRNEFGTIDAYNRQAGELAEPYRFLVVADYPANFTEAAARRLCSIVGSGARCGVFTLVMQDQRLGLGGVPLEDLVGDSLHLVHDGERFAAADPLLARFPLMLDEPPAEDELTRIMHEVGQGAKDALRVELPFTAIVPPEAQYWTRAAASELTVPIGHAGAVRLQHFRLGRGITQHALVAGKTGSGKSTLLHVIITNLALWYGPDEVELYLVDFKKGVEFKTYVTHGLPHARAIAIESDREFGVSVLQRLDAEMTRRGELFRAAGVQDLAAYRAATGQKLPRTLLIVDEFQVFFTEDDKLAQDAGVLLDRLVRQGRAFGLHVLLGSQTLGGAGGLARGTMGQMAVRIALQCSEADSQLILDDTNVAARLLSRPGEAIYNDAGGLVAGNSIFQVAWLPDERQAEYLERARALAEARGVQVPPPVVFEGNAMADLRQNRLLGGLIAAPQWPQAPHVPQVWLGEAVAIKDPTSVPFRRQSGANLLLVGQRDDAALAMFAAAVVCLGAQHAPGTARFVILGGAAAETPVPGALHDAAALWGDAVRWVDWHEVGSVIAELAAEQQRRLESGPGAGPTIYVLVYGLQRYRALRRREETFSFSSSDEDAAPATDKQFADLLREGPALGLHVIAWSDTLATLERTLDRAALREFDFRVLFQMSAADSSNLIDTPEANRLGLYRALLFSEERGLLEKFRPYGLLEPDWLTRVRESLARRAASIP